MLSSWSSQKFLGTIRKMIAINSKPTEASFPELPSVLIWMRAILAIAYGWYLGTHNIRSGVLVINMLNLVAFIPVMYCRLYLNVQSTDQYSSSILFSGLFQAMALALLVWIYCFTSQHEETELKLSNFLILPTAPISLEDNDGTTTTEAASSPEISVSEDSEF
jgi:hypothetical protein